MTKKIPSCVFCNIESKLKIHTTKNFLVLLDPYPLIEGHLMICSQKHYGCVGELSEKMLEEIDFLKQAVTAIIKKTYKSVCIYEHGRAGGCISTNPNNRMCHHCHLHILPFEGNLNKDLKLRFEEKKMDNFSEIKECYEGYGEYLYVEDLYGKKTFYPVNENEVPVHYFRTIISEYLGKPYLADWSLASNYDKHQLVSTINNIKKYIYLFDKK